MMPLRWKLWGLIALAFALGLLGWRKASVDKAIAEAEAKRNEKRLQAVLKAKEIRDEVESQDDVHLADRARGWLRSGDR